MEHLESKTEGRPKLTFRGKVILGIAGATFTTVCALTTPFILPALRKVCLPYVPATTVQVNNVMSLLKGRQGRMVDLGSGDGRIVIEAAKLGHHAEGVELNPWLVWYSRWSAYRAGVRSSTSFHTTDLWKFDLSRFDYIVIFGVESMMEQLQSKLNEDLSRSGQVIACRFPLASWTPVQTVGEGIDAVWLYSRSGTPINSSSNAETHTNSPGQTDR